MHGSEPIEPPSTLRASLGVALMLCLHGLARFISGPPQSLTPCTSGLIFHGGALYLRNPRVLACLVWVLHVPCTFFIEYLSLTHTLPSWFLALFLPVPGSPAGLIYVPTTTLQVVEGLVGYFNFYVVPSSKNTLLKFTLFVLLRSFLWVEDTCASYFRY